MSPAPGVGPGTRVRLDYLILLEDGTRVEDSGDQPLEFEFGDQALPQAIQRSLVDMRAGDTGSFEFGPFEVWGATEPELRQTLPVSDFGDAGPPEVGSVMEFALPDGRLLSGTIESVEADSVAVDFNHPLHARSIRVDVRILAVERAE